MDTPKLRRCRARRPRGVRHLCRPVRCQTPLSCMRRTAAWPPRSPSEVVAARCPAGRCPTPLSCMGRTAPGRPRARAEGRRGEVSAARCQTPLSGRGVSGVASRHGSPARPDTSAGHLRGVRHLCRAQRGPTDRRARAARCQAPLLGRGGGAVRRSLPARCDARTRGAPDHPSPRLGTGAAV